jgi:hypothetical protein
MLGLTEFIGGYVNVSEEARIVGVELNAFPPFIMR